ncbi:hypothetical protein Bca52824_039704 [Brassica carinata]|uniref:Uncharacterized protein n=1 Tax=Brassica carinata TaxID=52824 RepID=A0A8X7RU54_BRACI|nr:hypothetical protein Bca52824_039704 [Brassica carinata]
MTHRVQLPKIDEARLNALRNPFQPSEHMADNFEQLSDDTSESMQVDQTSEKRTLRKRKEKTITGSKIEPSQDSFTFVDHSTRNFGRNNREILRRPSKSNGWAHSQYIQGGHS